MKELRKLAKNKEVQKLVLFVTLILAGFVLGANQARLGLDYFSKNKVAGEEITSRELKNKIADKDFVFINVHTPYEGEIEKTDTFISYDMIVANKDRLPEDKNTPIVVYCKSGNMSKSAMQTLTEMGYRNVSHLEGGWKAWEKAGNDLLDLSSLPNQVLPEEGFELPISWSDLGPRMVSAGVIDSAKFEETMELTDEQRSILYEGSDESMTISGANSRFVVNMLWALGLAQKSLVYEKGPMGTEYQGRVGNFASTGGWTLAKGDAVNYLNSYDLIGLDEAEQARVAEIAKNVYRPCCGNSTWFPDCNHGMAALAAIELMVDAGLSDEEIYSNTLKLNSFWFPGTYLTTATHHARQGVDWTDVDAKEVLGESYSSAKGASEIASKVGPLPFEGQTGGSCGA